MDGSVSPLYTIHRYRDDIYKIVSFKGNRDSEKVFLREPQEQQHNDTKLDCNFSRARSMVLQYALCNPWQYFFTGTIDRRKFDRFDLDVFQEKLSQFIRDKRKKYGVKFSVLLVPEHHQDGAWHVHGLVYGLPPNRLSRFVPPAPRHLMDRGFLNWPDYMDKFGFCSLAPIKDPVATAFYITKYVSKDLSRRGGDLGKHLYLHSRPLKKAEKASDVYLYNKQLDGFCTAEFDFCKTGMVEDADWSFPYVWDGAEVSGPVSPLFPPVPLSVDRSFNPGSLEPDFEQLKLEL